MLIYNSTKEFLGIDEIDLKNLGFESFAQLRAQVSDIADLFVKTPGFIHNFKHVHWIDFITCADSAETPKVIISIDDRSFRCNLEISTAYLTDNQTEQAYLVYLHNLRELKGSEITDFASDITNKTLSKPLESTQDKQFIAQERPQASEAMPKTAPTEIKVPTAEIKPHTSEPSSLQNINEDSPNLGSSLDDLFNNTEDETIQTKEDETLNIQEDIKADTQEDDFKLDIQEDDLKLDIQEDDLKLDIQEDDLKLDIQEDVKNDNIYQEENQYAEDDEYDELLGDYVFDPKIASDELGLPIDLIEEFIDDFIAQSKEFKSELYSSLNDGDIDNVKVLSHKLKGVAANLRIEDAFEVLTTINTSDDLNVIGKNLNRLYIIIAKLAGEHVEIETKKSPLNESETVVSQEDDDDFVLDVKDVDTPTETLQEEEQKDEDETPELLSEDITPANDSDVSQEVEVAELADDNFLNNEPVEIDEESLSLDIETVNEKELPEDVTPVNDSDVPQKIEVAELADDDFLNNEPVEIDEESLSLDIETVDEKELSADVSDIDDLPDLLEPQDLEESTETESVKTTTYDKQNIADEIGLDMESFNELFEDYLVVATQVQTAIGDAIANENVELWQSEAMKLKGMSDNMRIHNFTTQLETLLQTSDTQEASKAAQELKILLSEISTLEA
jgi:hypothetical protein